jgi:hypothetical protein
MPSSDGTTIFVTKSDLAPLGAYVAGLQAFVIAARGCLEAKP